MMRAIRRVVAYLATGTFFAVAAVSLLQGAPMWDSMLKATASCTVIYVIGRAFISVIDEAAWRVDSGKPLPKKSVKAQASSTNEEHVGRIMADTQ